MLRRCAGRASPTLRHPRPSETMSWCGSWQRSHRQLSIRRPPGTNSGTSRGRPVPGWPTGVRQAPGESRSGVDRRWGRPAGAGDRLRGSAGFLSLPVIIERPGSMMGRRTEQVIAEGDRPASIAADAYRAARFDDGSVYRSRSSMKRVGGVVITAGTYRGCPDRRRAGGRVREPVVDRAGTVDGRPAAPGGCRAVRIDDGAAGRCVRSREESGLGDRSRGRPGASRVPAWRRVHGRCRRCRRREASGRRAVSCRSMYRVAAGVRSRPALSWNEGCPGERGFCIRTCNPSPV